MVESMEALGLNVKLGKYVTERYGYLAGGDRKRAEDVNRMIRDDTVQALLLTTGGWGSSRILPFLDYEAIRSNPKVIVGYSDVTALLLGIHAKTGLVTYHGPNGTSPWNSFTVDHFRSVLFEGEALTMSNPKGAEDTLVPVDHRIRTIRSGTVEGRLLGGNLTVLTRLIGTDYLPEWDDAILFTEDIREDVYRIDRMLTQLKQTGILEAIRGFVFGTCKKCDAERRIGGFTLEDVFDQHIAPLDIPAWSGAMIGHLEKKFTVPIGIRAAIDADRGTITLLEPAVR
jgi:muramoyltetrapeptide carboxypeptidase